MKTKNERAITLITLIITIILMLILAGVVLSLSIGRNGMIKKAQESVAKYNKEQAREKLELVLFNMQADKVNNSEYNDDKYLTSRIEENDMSVDGNIVEVNGWFFEIDRTIPKIITSYDEMPTSIKITKVNGNYVIMELNTNKIIKEYDIYINGKFYEKVVRIIKPYNFKS